MVFGDTECTVKNFVRTLLPSRLQVLAPSHAKLDVVRVHTTVLGERHAKLISVLGDGELARDILVDFNSDADAFDAGVVDGCLVSRLVRASVDLRLQANLDITGGVAQVDGGILARHVVFNGRGDVIVVDEVLERQVDLDGRAVGTLVVAVDLGALLREGDGHVAELVVRGGDAEGTSLALRSRIEGKSSVLRVIIISRTRTALCLRGRAMLTKPSPRRTRTVLTSVMPRETLQSWPASVADLLTVRE